MTIQEDILVVFLLSSLGWKKSFYIANLIFSIEGVGFQNLALFTSRISKDEGFNSAPAGNYQERSWLLRNWCTGFHNKYLELECCPMGRDMVIIKKKDSMFASAAVFEINPLQSHWAG